MDWHRALLSLFSRFLSWSLYSLCPLICFFVSLFPSLHVCVCISKYSIIHSLIQTISIAPIQVHYYSKALPTQHATGNCELKTCPRPLRGGYIEWESNPLSFGRKTPSLPMRHTRPTNIILLCNIMYLSVLPSIVSVSLSVSVRLCHFMSVRWILLPSRSKLILVFLCKFVSADSTMCIDSVYTVSHLNQESSSCNL